VRSLDRTGRAIAPDRRLTTERSAAKDVAVAISLAGLVIAMIADTRVPLLAYVDLGFHELGHLLTYPLPDLLTAMAGSFVQVAVPLGLAAYFFLRRDHAGSALCLGWAATSAYDVARYVADAPYERLELLGGDHDWAFVLFELNATESAGAYAAVTRVFAWVVMLGAIALLAAPHAARRRERPTG
jgi:hypothetical protein